MAHTNNVAKALNSFDGFNGAELATALTNEAEYLALQNPHDGGSIWLRAVPTWSQVSAKITELDDADAQKVTDKASAKAKLIAGEALTEAEADTIVL